MFKRATYIAMFSTCLLLGGSAIETAEANEASSSVTVPSKPAVRSHRRAPRARPAAPRSSGGTKWAAVAVSLKNNGVSSGIGYGYTEPSRAVAAALESCRASGRPGCYVAIGPVTGCLYVSISRGGQSNSAWGTSGTASGARARCESHGLDCKPPQGGC